MMVESPETVSWANCHHMVLYDLILTFWKREVKLGCHMSFSFCKCWIWLTYMKHWTLCSGLYVVGHQFAVFAFGCFRLFQAKGKVVHSRPGQNLKWSRHFPSLPAFFFFFFTRLLHLDGVMWPISGGTCNFYENRLYLSIFFHFGGYKV